jgi:acyl-CoA oxidase
MAVETVIERTSVHKLLERVKDLLPGGDEWTRRPGCWTRLPAGDAALPRGAHAGRRRAPAQARHRPGMNPGEVFSRVQDHVIAAARAHVERLVLEAFVDKLAASATATPRSRSACSATCTRSPRSRPTGPGSWSTGG